MNIKLLRMALCMNTATAARYLAARPDYPDGVSETTWVRWENGKKEIPQDVQNHLQTIADRLNNVLIGIARLGVDITNNGGHCPMTMTYHDSLPADMDVLEYHIGLATTVWANALGINVEQTNG